MDCREGIQKAGTRSGRPLCSVVGIFRLRQLL